MTDQPGATLVDVRGLNCPIPLLKTKRAMAVAAPGETVVVLVTDSDSVLDIRGYAQLDGIGISVSEEPSGVWRLALRKP